MECMTCSFATRYRRDLAPRYPLACSRISRRFFRPWTLRLTRGMCDPLVRLFSQEAPDALPLGPNVHHARHPALPATRFLDQHMVPGRLPVEDLPRLGQAEPFGRTPMRLHLRH